MAKNIAATVDTVLIIGMPLFICTSFSITSYKKLKAPSWCPALFDIVVKN
jgi:hypothetical protein